MSKEIHLDSPNIGVLEKKYLNKAIDSGYVSTAGPYVSDFEKRFSEFIGSERVVSVQSGTAALHMALHELGITKGDEVIVPALTFIATANPVSYVGAKPVFADVDIRTWDIDPEEIERRITKRTRAIIPVHFYGNPCDMDRITDIAKRHNLRVIEDATESLGAKYRKRHTGTIGDLGCFSFNGNKVMTTGGGGMVVGKDDKALGHIRFLINQARDNSKEHYHPEIGFNYRMTNIEAALGLAQMEKLKGFLRKKKEFNDIYRKELRGVRSIKFQEAHDGAESSHWFTAVMLKGRFDVSEVQKRLLNKKVPARRVFMPLTEFPPYRRSGRKGFENSYDIYKSGLCLPSSTLNDADDVYRVCKAIRQVLSG